MRPIARLFVVVATVVLVPGGLRSDAPKERKAIYNDTANARAEIALAVSRAKNKNKRVLLVYGGNWCGWCHKLHDLFSKDRAIRQILFNEYELVSVDIGRFDKNIDIVDGYGAQIKTGGVPYLTVLDGNGKPLANQETGALEKGDKHDPSKVRTFLEKYAPPPLDAERTLKDALSTAGKKDKRVLVHLGAPW